MKQWILKHAARYLIEQKQKPVTHTDLKYIGVDSNGMKYYGFDDLSLLPNCRRIELEKATMFMDARLDPATLEKIGAAIREAADFMRMEQDAKKRAGLQAKIIALTEELSRREQYATPKYFHIELAAILNVAEDENPSKIDREIHNRKSAQFTKELEAYNSFFFKNPIYCELLNLSVGGEVSLERLFSRWELDENRQKERIQAISSYTSSSNSSSSSSNG